MNNRRKRYSINMLAIIAIYIVIKLLITNGILDRYFEGIIITIGINIILAVSLNLTTGFLGQLTLGQAGFMAIGAYASAIISKGIGDGIPEILLLLISIILGGLVASVFGFIVGVPALRLRGDYLGIITLGFGEIIRVLLINLEFTGGALGLRGISKLSTFDNVFWIMAVIIIMVFSFMNSRHGRSIISIRENEIASEACGVNTAYYKIFTFVMSAFLAGVSGGLFAHFQRSVVPNKFDFMYSIEILVIVVLGGMGSITGSIIAAIILTILPEALRDLSDYRLLIYSLLLLVVMLFKPSGLLGTKEFSLLRKRRSEDVKTEGLGGEE